MRHLKQNGAVLPSVLGVLVLILIISHQLTETVLSNHKTNNAYQAQLQAEALAEFALNETEAALRDSLQKPIAVQTATQLAAGETQISEGIVWQRNLLNYNLDVEKDTLTNQQIDWSRQPETWWNSYSNKFLRNISATESQTAYSIVEEYSEDFSGSDLGQARDHYSGPSRMLYQITVRGDGGAVGTSRLRTIEAKVYR